MRMAARAANMKLFQLNGICFDEQTAFKFLQDNNILQKERKCVNNHNMNVVWSSKKSVWRCGICGATKGFRVNNWLENSRLPFLKIVRFIYCWSREMTSIKFCEHELEIDDQTVTDWNNYLREVCAYEIMSCCGPSKVGGEGLAVEVDESCFSRRKSIAGRVDPKQWVFGGICRDTKDMFMVLVPDRSTETLCGVIKEKVCQGSIIKSDCWKGYMNLDKDNSFQDLSENYRYGFVDPDTGAQNIGCTWRNAKIRNKMEFGTRNLESYFIEFLWREYIKTQKKDAFQAILEAIARYMPPEM